MTTARSRTTSTTRSTHRRRRCWRGTTLPAPGLPPDRGSELHLAAGRRVPLHAPSTVLPIGAADFVMVVLGLGLFAPPCGSSEFDWRVYWVVALRPQVTGEMRVAHLTPACACLRRSPGGSRDARLRPGIAVGVATALKFFVWPLGCGSPRGRRYSAAALAALDRCSVPAPGAPFTSLGNYVRASSRVGGVRPGLLHVVRSRPAKPRQRKHRAAPDTRRRHVPPSRQPGATTASHGAQQRWCCRRSCGSTTSRSQPFHWHSSDLGCLSCGSFLSRPGACRVPGSTPTMRPRPSMLVVFAVVFAIAFRADVSPGESPFRLLVCRATPNRAKPRDRRSPAPDETAAHGAPDPPPLLDQLRA